MTRSRTPIAPGRARGRRGAPSPRPPASRAKTIAALGLIVAAVALFGGVGLMVWRNLAVLPGVEEMRAASVAASAYSRDAIGRIMPEGETRSVAAAPSRSRPAPAAAEPAPPAAPATPRDEAQSYKLAIIESAGVIDVRSRRLQLAFVDAPDAERRCVNAGGASWPCGARARTALRRLVRARAIECRDRPSQATSAEGAAAPGAAAPAAGAPDAAATDAGAPEVPPAAEASAELLPATCEVGGVDLGRWLVDQGWAVPAAGAPEEFAALHDDARRSQRGLYAPSAR